MSVENVYPKVREIIADVLVIDEEDVLMKSRLIADLGAESIDFLDLIFQLEKEFAIKIPRGQLEKNARGELAEDEFEKNGVLTEEGMLALKAYLNEVPEENFGSKLKVNEIPTLFTVETFCKLVISAVEHKEVSAVEA
jgi:acyl carrier protein